MAEFRCPKHDRIFETLTDQRRPGAPADTTARLAAHPANGHPDCPKCQEEAGSMGAVKTAQPGMRRIA